MDDMLLDKYLGEYQFSERHAIEINAPAFQIIAAAAAYNPRQDPFFRRMIALRELPSRLLQRQTAAPSFGQQNFSQLERNEQELVYGLIGRFWLASYGLVDIAVGPAFLGYRQPGVAKLALGYAVHPSSGGNRLVTETRIFCPDRASRLRFTPYWYAIRLVSGLIRRRMLRAIKTACESAPAAQQP
jgi:hypothetical protein